MFEYIRLTRCMSAPAAPISAPRRRVHTATARLVRSGTVTCLECRRRENKKPLPSVRLALRPMRGREDIENEGLDVFVRREEFQPPVAPSSGSSSWCDFSSSARSW
eukprot:2750806-Pleurochrysis_carterae.AAC.2